MFIGHFAVAFGAKAAAPKANLGVLIAAAQLPDLLWPILLLAGWEEVRIAPGDTAFTPLEFTRYPVSHSLLTVVAWGVLAAGLYYAVRRYSRGAAIVGILVVSHWILDWITHRPDLPLTPWGSARAGLGLWSSVPATLIIESVMFGIGVFLYARTTTPVRRSGQIVFLALVATLLLIYAGNVVSPPPPDPNAIAYVTLGILLFPLLGAWADEARRSSKVAV